MTERGLIMSDIERTIDDLKLMNRLCHGTVFDDAIALIEEQQEIIKTLALHIGAKAILSGKEKPEVVCCCECKWNSGKAYNPYCQKQSRKRKPDWFCADGERRTDDA